MNTTAKSVKNILQSGESFVVRYWLKGTRTPVVVRIEAVGYGERAYGRNNLNACQERAIAFEKGAWRIEIHSAGMIQISVLQSNGSYTYEIQHN